LSGKNLPGKNVLNVNLDLEVLPSCEAEAADLSYPSGSLSKTVLLTAIAVANTKVIKQLYIRGIPSPHLTLQTSAPF